MSCGTTVPSPTPYRSTIPWYQNLIFLTLSDTINQQQVPLLACVFQIINEERMAIETNRKQIGIRLEGAQVDFLTDAITAAKASGTDVTMSGVFICGYDYVRSQLTAEQLGRLASGLPAQAPKLPPPRSKWPRVPLEYAVPLLVFIAFGAVVGAYAVSEHLIALELRTELATMRAGK